MIFKNASGQEIWLKDGISQSLTQLQPERLKRSKVVFIHCFQPQSSYTFNTGLRLESMDEEKRLRTGRRQASTLGRRAVLAGTSKNIILVINNQTTPKRLLSGNNFSKPRLPSGWRFGIFPTTEILICKQLILRILNGNLLMTLQEKRSFCSTTSLNRILPSGCTQTDYLSRSDLAFGINQRQINFMIVGGLSSDSAHALADTGLTPTRAGAGT